MSPWQVALRYSWADFTDGGIEGGAAESVTLQRPEIILVVIEQYRRRVYHPVLQALDLFHLARIWIYVWKHHHVR